jgi:hypothetical protein
MRPSFPLTPSAKSFFHSCALKRTSLTAKPDRSLGESNARFVIPGSIERRRRGRLSCPRQDLRSQQHAAGLFVLFHEDAVQVPRRRRPSKKVLGGSRRVAGDAVGKSISSSSLRRSTRPSHPNVVYYYRRVGAEAASVFAMTPDTDGSRVRIWFARNVGS